MQITRVNRSKTAAKKAYDRLSGVYDLLAGSSETQFTRQGMEMLAVELEETVLEIGSGTGRALLEFCALVGDSGNVYGIDLSPGMLQKARNRLERSGASTHVSLLEGDGAHLPYQSGSFSAVFISFTLELFDTPEIPLVLAECQRVLKPGGRLGVVAMLKTTSPSFIVRLYEWFHAHLPTYVDCRPINAHEMIQAAGFSSVKQGVRSMWGLPVELVVARKV